MLAILVEKHLRPNLTSKDISTCIVADLAKQEFQYKVNNGVIIYHSLKVFFNKKNFSFLFLIGPPSASQPSRKNKCKDEPDVVGQPQQQQTTSQIKVRRVSGTTSNVTSTTTPVTVVTTPMVKSVSQVTKPNIPLNTISTTPNTYQTEPMTVQLAVNAQGQPRILTTSKPASLPVSLIT